MADAPDILPPITPARPDAATARALIARRHKLSNGLRAGHRHAVMTAPNGDSLPPEVSPPDVAISARRTTGVDFPSRLQFTLECCAALRRAELTAATWDNLVFTADGGLRVLIPRAKGDPEGEGGLDQHPTRRSQAHLPGAGARSVAGGNEVRLSVA